MDLTQMRLIKQVLVTPLSNKLKTLYLHQQSACGQQTWQDGNLPWWAPVNKVTWVSDHVVLEDDVTN